MLLINYSVDLQQNLFVRKSSDNIFIIYYILLGEGLCSIYAFPILFARDKKSEVKILFSKHHIDLLRDLSGLFFKIPQNFSWKFRK